MYEPTDLLDFVELAELDDEDDDDEDEDDDEEDDDEEEEELQWKFKLDNVE